MFQFSVTVLIISLLGCCYAKPDPIISKDDPDRSHFLLPYVVGIEKKDDNICAGSLIKPAVVLTAAHCLEGKKVYDLLIRAGSLYANKDGQTRTLRDYIIHPDYGKVRNIDYDLAVIQLSAPYDIRHPSIATIQLAKERVPEGTFARISGWGRLGPNGTYPQRMKSVLVATTNEAYCQKLTKWKPGLDPKICAGGREGACDGDSGGPLVVNAQQIGISTHAIEYCTYKNLPEFYIDIIFMRDWIERYANKFQSYFS